MKFSDRLRRSFALRVLLVLSAVFSSQSSLACLFEDGQVAQTAISIVDSHQSATPAADESSCTLCFGCAQCGSCCVFAVSQRVTEDLFAPAPFSYEKIGLATTASILWTPPTLLRPPNNLT